LGLDTYAMVIKENPTALECMPDSLFEEHGLTQGIFAYNSNCFRGKIYNDYVEYVTGISLYQEHIPNTTVKEMAVKLRTAANNFFTTSTDFHNKIKMFGVRKEEATDLAIWFETVANNNGIVCGWW
jgi:hypothetical protein